MSYKKVTELREKFKKSKRNKWDSTYVVPEHERESIENHFGSTIFEIDRICSGITLPDGVYLLHDPLVEKNYIFVDGMETLSSSLIFLIDSYNTIHNIICLGKDDPEPEYSDQMWVICMGINGRWTLKREEEYG